MLRMWPQGYIVSWQMALRVFLVTRIKQWSMRWQGTKKSIDSEFSVINVTNVSAKLKEMIIQYKNF